MAGSKVANIEDIKNQIAYNVNNELESFTSKMLDDDDLSKNTQDSAMDPSSSLLVEKRQKYYEESMLKNAKKKFSSDLINENNKSTASLKKEISDNSTSKEIQVKLQTFKPAYNDTTENKIAEYIIDLMFLFDIIFNFRATYIESSTGEEIYDPKRIAYKYLTGYRFYLDLFSTIPFDKIFSPLVNADAEQFLSALGMLKLFRITKISGLIQKINVSRATKAMFKVLQLIFFLVLFIHFQACIYFFIARQYEEWIPNEDFIYRKTEIFSMSPSYQYWVCMYYSAMLFSISDMVAATTAELAFTSVMMLICAMITANIFGLIAVLTSQMNEKSSKFQEQMDIANTAMKNIKLSLQLRNEVCYYLLMTRTTQDQQEEFQRFLDDISPSLRIEIQNEIFMIAIKKNELLMLVASKHDKHLKLIDIIVKNLEIQLESPENEIVKQGSDDTEAMYFVQKGDCSVLVQDKIGLEAGIKREVSLIYNCRRTATVTANNYCTLARLSINTYRTIANKHPIWVKEMKEQIFVYDDDVKVFMQENLKKVQYLKSLDEDIFHEVMFNFTQETFDRGAFLFKESEQSNAMFVVKNGIVEISCQIENQELVIERLYRGSIINHRSFLVADKSDISCKCAQTMTLFYLTFDQIKRLRMKNSKLNQEILAIESSVKAKENPYIIDYIMSRGVQHNVNRSREVEDKRNDLTCTLKNMVLYHLINFKIAQKKPSFKEVIAQVIRKKKEEMKKQRKRKLAMLMGEQVDEDEDEIEGFNKDQTEQVIEQLTTVRKKFTKNNQDLEQLDKIVKEYTEKSEIQVEQPNTPKFRRDKNSIQL
ncbi:cyclic nucleotide-binding protein [Stylonychia lemnae]|uniref:Cyclic nucleotide-binding protein n=1 Tax=Stylonychia lemnae TaxID=5949 RepID=A0A078AMS5_STYLE|nr:cyclic nucleotide-binding protein [Stylonychia lemnae]|eukprot:CDW83695.1 cyclic nucleotide-binding protein [Stylonychia lemnae]